MRAAVHTEYGPPEVVRVRQVPDPELVAGEVLVRVQVATVNRTDCAYRAAHPWFMRALTGLRRPRRTVLGTEYAGKVAAVGEVTTDLIVGDQVFGYCEGRFGAHAELLAVPADSTIARIPDGVEVTKAAASTEGAHYARSAIRRAGVRPGNRVLVIGATGGHRLGRRPAPGAPWGQSQCSLHSRARGPRSGARGRAGHRPLHGGFHGPVRALRRGGGRGR